VPAGLQNLAALAGRLLLAFIFVVEGWLKVVHYDGILGYMEGYGVPGALLPLVILTELGGGFLVAVGLLTRLAALALAGFCLLTAFFFHLPAAATDENEMIHLLKNLAMAGGFLTLVAFGAGAWSVDFWRLRRRAH
jgi:putative oxidoreductase